jgi:DNA-binding NarL/FixJ family response regulator
MAPPQDSQSSRSGGYFYTQWGEGEHVSCRVIILYTNALFGHGLHSLLTRQGGFEVPVVAPKDADLATAVREYRPDVIIVEGEGLSPGNARALLEAAWGEPRVRVVNIRDDARQPTVWRAVTIVPEGQESAAEALERVLAAHPGVT